jgi:hypothetical protein
MKKYPVCYKVELLGCCRYLNTVEVDREDSGIFYFQFTGIYQMDTNDFCLFV